MSPRRRSSSTATWVATAVCVLATWRLCACAPTGDVRADATTTEDVGLYRPPPPGEDGAYLPEQDDQQGASNAGAYFPERYETAESAGEERYDPKKYETVEGFDDGKYRPEHGSEEHDNGAYHPEIAEKTDGDDGSYHGETGKTAEGEDGSYRPVVYERSDGNDGAYNPETYESIVGDNGAYHPDTAENVVGDDGLYHPDTNESEDNGGAYNPEVHEMVVGDDGSYRSEGDDGSYQPNNDGLLQDEDGLYHPEIHEQSDSRGGNQEGPGALLNAVVQLQTGNYNGVAQVGRQVPTIRVRRQLYDHSAQYDSIDVLHKHNNLNLEDHVYEIVDFPAKERRVRETYSNVYRLQKLEEEMEQNDDGAYLPERYETPAPEGTQDSEKYWTEGSVAADGDSETGNGGSSEASDDGSYRVEHQQAEDYDERADNGQNSVTSPVEPTEASDDGSYRPQEFTETPAEDYDEKADNGTDWRSNVVEHHDEGTEAADDGSYRPQEHGPRSRRGASEDTEEVQLSPVVFHVGPKPSSDVSPKASSSVSNDDAHGSPPPEGHQVPAATD